MAGSRCMVVFFVFCLFAAFGALPRARADDIDLTMLNPSPVTAERGSNLTLSCKANKGLTLLLGNAIVWRKESRVRELTNETLSISRGTTLLVNDQLAARYKVTIGKGEDEGLVASLRIQNVEDVDDGHYTCEVQGLGDSKVVAKGEVDVIVPKAAELVLVKMNGTVQKNITKVIEGSYIVLFLAEGLNPEPEDVRVELDSQNLTIRNVSISLMPLASTSAGAPRYRIQADVRLEIHQEDDRKHLSFSTVSSEAVGFTTLRLVPKPSVDCKDVMVHRNETHAELVCVVTHVNVMVRDYVWVLNGSGGGSADNRTGVKQELSDTQTKVSLGVKKWGEQRTRFELTAVTEVGEVSEVAYVIVASDEKETGSDDSDNDGDDGAGKEDAKGDNTNRASGWQSKMMWNQAVIVLLVLLLTCLHA